jgi:hypothetical protein
LPDFRPCSTCRSRSQAPLCQCTQRVISIHPEGTFGASVTFGRRPPQSNCPPGTVPCLITRGLGVQTRRVVFHRWLHPPKGPASQPPTYPTHLAPTQCQAAVKLHGVFLSCAGNRIFTVTSISPSPSLRQRPDRYAIRAGRNLPDKEFRYLRTVIVTAAVHRGFGSSFSSPLNLPALGRRQPLYISLRLAETCVFVKQSPGPAHCGPRRSARSPHPRGTPSPEVTGLICRVP